MGICLADSYWKT